MTFEQYESWMASLSKKQGWDQLNPFIRMNFMSEEVGELAQAVRRYEIGRGRPDEVTQSANVNRNAIMEEMGDVVSNLVILARYYDMSFQDIFDLGEAKLEARFKEQ